MSRFFAISLVFFLIIDAFGAIPPFLTLVRKSEKKRRLFLSLRELFFALLLMILFYFVGKELLTFLALTEDTVRIAGAITLFLIAIRLIFSEQNKDAFWGDNEPFIVPIATPLIAGPSLLAIIMIYSLEEPSQIVLGAIFLSWLLSGIVFLCASPLYLLMKDKGLLACQRLMGLIVGLIAVQNFLQGIASFMSKR